MVHSRESRAFESGLGRTANMVPLALVAMRVRLVFSVDGRVGGNACS